MADDTLLGVENNGTRAREESAQASHPQTFRVLDVDLDVSFPAIVNFGNFQLEPKGIAAHNLICSLPVLIKQSKALKRP